MKHTSCLARSFWAQELAAHCSSSFCSAHNFRTDPVRMPCWVPFRTCLRRENATGEERTESGAPERVRRNAVEAYLVSISHLRFSAWRGTSPVLSTSTLFWSMTSTMVQSLPRNLAGPYAMYATRPISTGLLKSFKWNKLGCTKVLIYKTYLVVMQNY